MKLGANEMNLRKRNIVIIAGKKSHGPDDNGVHDYPAQARLLEYALQQSTLAEKIEISRFEDDNWSSEIVRTADCIVIISDGRDGYDLPFVDASHISSEERMSDVDSAVEAGAGVVPIHFATFTPERNMQRVLNWQGAAFEWEKNGRRNWSSVITWRKDVLKPLCEHPVLSGVSTDAISEEFYHKLAFHSDAKPLIAIETLPGDNIHQKTVAWVIERKNGGRSFGTSMAHSLDKLRHDGVRTLICNGISWSAGLDIPETGLQVAYAEREVVNYALKLGPKPESIRVTILAGNNAHRWHNWPETTGAFLNILGDDSRVSTRVATDPLDLVQGLSDCDVLILNWVNWYDPVGFPEVSREALQAFTKRGGGVFVHHFSNGACHRSLPDAGDSHWPWYSETLVRRIWDHDKDSQHDHYGIFEVKPCSDHPLVAEIGPFKVQDELYFNQAGTEEINVLMTAKSKITGKDEPMLWNYKVNKSRVVQSMLGHSAKTYESSEMRVLVRRIIAWCAKRQIHGPAYDTDTCHR